MILHIRQMEHGTLHLQGAESPQPLGLEEYGIVAAGDLSYTLDAGLSGGGVWVVGSLHLPLLLECVKCLERFAYTVDIREFAVQISAEETGGREAIDLTPWVREDILLALPPYPKCDGAGGKVCPEQFLSQDFAPRGDESPQVRETAWAALDQLKTKPSN